MGRGMQTDGWCQGVRFWGVVMTSPAWGLDITSRMGLVPGLMAKVTISRLTLSPRDADDAKHDAHGANGVHDFPHSNTMLVAAALKRTMQVQEAEFGAGARGPARGPGSSPRAIPTQP